MVNITETFNLIEAIVILVAIVGIVYGLKIRADAVIDVKTRHEARINSGREELARLLVVTSTLLCLALACFLIVGVGSAFIPYRPGARPSSYILQGMLVASEMLLSGALWYKQRVRRRVFVRDLQIERDRIAAVTEQARLELVALTDAVAENTRSTDANTLSRTAETRGEDG